MCMTLWCKKDNRCMTRLEPAAEGTICAENMVRHAIILTVKILQVLVVAVVFRWQMCATGRHTYRHERGVGRVGVLVRVQSNLWSRSAI